MYVYIMVMVICAYNESVYIVMCNDFAYVIVVCIQCLRVCNGSIYELLQTT